MVVILATNGKSGPYGGKVRLVLAVMAVLGLGVAWISAIRDARKGPSAQKLGEPS
jgi:hypothetical protein